MGDTYHYNVPGIVIHMIHLIFWYMVSIYWIQKDHKSKYK